MLSLTDEYRQPDDAGDRRIAELADRQHGVVATCQLLAMGYTHQAIRTRVRAGRLHRTHRGVYAVGRTRLALHGRWMAAVLACGPEAVLSHYCAAALFDLQRPPSTRIDVTAPGKHELDGVRCHTARFLPQQDRAIIDAIPVTSLNRTLLDQAQDLSAQRLRSTLEAAQRRDLLDPPALRALIVRSSGHHGTKPLKAALADLADEAPWTQSELEQSFLELVRAAGLPEPSANVLVHGVLVDFYWHEHRLVVEIDGYESHRTHRSFEEDRRRDRILTLAGVRVIRITYQQIEHGAGSLITDLRRLIGSAA